MNAWVQVEPCSTVTPPTPPAASNLFMEALIVSAMNTLPPLTKTPDGSFIMLVANGMVFLPVGASPPFSLAGQQITWLSTIYGLNIGDDVGVAYSYSGSA